MRPSEASQKPVIELEPTEAASLRAFAFDARPRTADVVTDDSIRRRDSNNEPADVAAPTRRIPPGAKLLFGFVLGGCAVVLGLAAPALRTDLAAMNTRRAPARAAAPEEPRSVLTRAPAPSAPIAEESSRSSMPTTSRDVPTVPTTGASVEAPDGRHAFAGPEQATGADGSPSVDAKTSKATIRLSKKAHELRVDGKLARGASVEVSCGPHLVAVDKGRPRRVEAVCGKVVVVDETKARVLRKGDEVHGRGTTRAPSAPSSNALGAGKRKAR